MKIKSVNIILALSIFILLLVNFNEYRRRKNYDLFDYSTSSVGMLAKNIRTREAVLNRILENNYITKEDATIIRYHSKRIPQFKRYAILLRELQQYKDEYVTETAMINVYNFIDMILEEKSQITNQELDSIVVKLDDNLRIKIGYLYELNNLWLNSLERNHITQKEETSIKLKRFLIDIETDTRGFMDKYKISDMDELLN